MGSLDLGDEDVEMSQQLPSLGADFDIELREAEEGDAKTLQLQLKKTAMEGSYNKAVEALTRALEGFNKKQFLKTLEENVLYEGGDLSVFYQELAKLDALNWLKRHKNELLKLELPLAIELSINYQRNAQPETLITFYDEATRLLEPPKKTGARSSSETSQKKKRRRKEEETSEISSGVPASVNKDALQEAVKSNEAIRKDYAERADFLGRHAEPADFLGKHRWFSEDGETKQVFIVSEPEPRQTKFNVKERSDDAPEEPNVELEQVFGAIRMKLTKDRKSRVFFRTKKDAKIYRGAKVYWENQVQKEAGLTGKPSWGDKNFNVKGVTISLPERAYHTPWIKKENDQEATITYVTKGGGVDTKSFPKKNANVPGAGLLGQDQLEKFFKTK